MKISRLSVFLWLPLALVADEAPLPIFDGHIHYNRDAWDGLTPAAAVKRLEAQGITRAIVSSTPTAGTELLYRAAPERVVPFLRPYRNESGRETWFSDREILQYIKARLDRIDYRGIGEFHLSSGQVDTSVVKGVIQLAQARKLFLFAHADARAIDELFQQGPESRIIWAHAGFDVPLPTLRAMLNRHLGLFLELSFREGIAPGGRLSPAWRALFLEYRDRFLVGMDTYIPGRWQRLPAIVAETRHWLAQLPPEVASAIAFGNAARLFPHKQERRSRWGMQSPGAKADLDFPGDNDQGLMEDPHARHLPGNRLRCANIS